MIWGGYCAGSPVPFSGEHTELCFSHGPFRVEVEHLHMIIPNQHVLS